MTRIVSLLNVPSTIDYSIVTAQQLVQRERGALHVLHLTTLHRLADAEKLNLRHGSREPSLQLPQPTPIQVKRALLLLIIVHVIVHLVPVVHLCGVIPGRGQREAMCRLLSGLRALVRLCGLVGRDAGGWFVRLAKLPEPLVHVSRVTHVLQQRVRAARVRQRIRRPAVFRATRASQQSRGFIHGLLQAQPRRRLRFGAKVPDGRVGDAEELAAAQGRGRAGGVRARDAAEERRRARPAVDAVVVRSGRREIDSPGVGDLVPLGV
mmetsp:Transcript_12094/g.56118  ORF Transcript_12094/g.56118 Transcript_12094/m.56118 type:complete len:265 (-) Transcript_12094:2014-2808(-)